MTKMVKNSVQYREQTSQMVSWGHWFALFNIILSLLISSQYLFIMDWPGSLLGRVYALVSWLGHFGFITFFAYILVLFPLTFIISSPRILGFFAAAYATAGLTLLLLDTEIFRHFYLHLNKLVWGTLTNPEQGELVRDWQWIFIFSPLLFLVEMLFGTWCWQKLRSLNRRTLAKPIIAVLITTFISSHLLYIWADANFYRPITMQKTNLPLAYPMTARGFLEKHGLINAQTYQHRLTREGNPTTFAIEYPRSKLSFYSVDSKYNLLMVVVDGVRAQDIAQDMPNLNQFAQNNIQFNHHFSSGNRSNTGIFGLFYGISPIYLDSVIAGQKSSLLINALGQRGYQMGLFATDGFTGTFERNTLFADISLPSSPTQDNTTTTRQWQQWLNSRDTQIPWFAYVSYQTTFDSPKNVPVADTIHQYYSNIRNVDTELGKLIDTLRTEKQFDNTVIVITAKHGIEFNDSGRDSGGSGESYSRAQIHVPLAIHWPGTPSQSLDKITSHEDIMLTLMQRLLQTKTPAQDYSQGEDLFSARRNKNWLLLGDSRQTVVITAQQTIILDKNGNYSVYDLDYRRQKKQQPSLGLLLQVFTATKHFVAD